jgi:hypothetical protein
MLIPAAAFGERVAVCTFRLGTVQSAALAIAGGAVPLQVTDVGVRSPATELQAYNSGLDDDAAFPRSRLSYCSLEPIGRGLAPATVPSWNASPRFANVVIDAFGPRSLDSAR